MAMVNRRWRSVVTAMLVGAIGGILGVIGLIVVGFVLIRVGVLDGSVWTIDGSVWGSVLTAAGVVVGSTIGFGIGAYHRSTRE